MKTNMFAKITNFTKQMLTHPEKQKTNQKSEDENKDCLVFYFFKNKITLMLPAEIK